MSLAFAKPLRNYAHADLAYDHNKETYLDIAVTLVP